MAFSGFAISTCFGRLVGYILAEGRVGNEANQSALRLERLANIVENVLNILNTHAQADKVGSYTGLG